MREVAIKIYKYKELSEEAKMVARNNYDSNRWQWFDWQEETMDAIESALDRFGCSMDIRGDAWNNVYYTLDPTFTEIMEMKGKRAFAYLSKKIEMERLNKPYFEKFPHLKNCVAGRFSYDFKLHNDYIDDYVLYDVWLDYVTEFKLGKAYDVTVEDFIFRVCDAFKRIIEAELSYETSEEYYESVLVDYEFYEDGRRY